jgi:ferredoxin
MVISLKKGRVFCSWVCPVGIIMWGFSYLSIFRINVDKSNCNGCNKCAKNCKSGAINDHSGKVNTSLCVGCFNCLANCESGAIKIRKKSLLSDSNSIGLKEISKDNIDAGNRRKFLKQLASGLVFLSIPVSFSQFSNETQRYRSEIKKGLVFPPGGEDHYHFLRNCTGCMVCAQKCPAKIIYPSVGVLSSSPVLPSLNFHSGYCTEDCIECLLVCPKGALRKMSIEEKKKTKIARLELSLNKCIIYTYSLECNICAEICPAEAIKMTSMEGASLPSPVVIQEACIGCGKCLYRCPSKGRENIFNFKSN